MHAQKANQEVDDDGDGGVHLANKRLRGKGTFLTIVTPKVQILMVMKRQGLVQKENVVLGLLWW